MQTINLNRLEVISQLEKAKQSAYEGFIKQRQQWKNKEIAALKAKLEAVQADRELECRCSNYQPSDKSDEYDSFIKMFELTKGDVIRVNETDWKRLFRLLKTE